MVRQNIGSQAPTGNRSTTSSLGVMLLIMAFIVMFLFMITGSLFPTLGFPSAAYAVAWAAALVGSATMAGWRPSMDKINVVGIIVGFVFIFVLLFIQVFISLVSALSPFAVVDTFQIQTPKQFLPLVVTPYVTSVWAGAAGVIEEHLFYNFLYKTFRNFGSGVTSLIIANAMTMILFAGFHIVVALAVGKVTNLWEFFTFPFIMSAGIARLSLNIINDVIPIKGKGGDSTVSMIGHGGMNSFLTLLKAQSNTVFSSVAEVVG